MYKKILTVLTILCITISASAQDEFDALRYGFTQQFGTARAMSIGGATGALGADFSSLSNNPAGIGLYRSSEFSITPNLSFENTNSSYLNGESTQNESKFNFNEFGIVIANAKKGRAYQRSKWKSFSFAFGMNRLANFNADYTYSGNDNTSSVIETLAQEINGLGGFTDDALNFSSDPAYAAYNTYLIDQSLDDSTLVSSFVPYQEGLLRTKNVRQTGSINEFLFSMGGNFQEKLMVGATLALPRIDYSRTETISEQDTSPNNDNDFDYFDLSQSVITRGTGINLKLGAIYKVTNSLRIGGAIHTPTAYQMTDISSVFMESNTEFLLPRNGGTSSLSQYPNADDNYSPLSFDYTYRSPLRASGNATYLFGKKGFISADVEYVDYDGMQYNYQGEFFAEEQAINNIIEETYKSAMNIRIGGEVRLKNIALRAGFASLGNPYENYSKGGLQRYSVGVGYRNKAFFSDFAFAYSSVQNLDLTHTLERQVDIPTADVRLNNTNAALTIGWRF